MGAGGRNRLGGETIEEVGGSTETLNPIPRRERSLEKQGANNIINGTDDTLRFTILRRRVGTRHPELRAMGEQEGARRGVIKLTPIVGLDGLDGATELCSNVGKEIGQSVKRVGFKFERKRP